MDEVPMPRRQGRLSWLHLDVGMGAGLGTPPLPTFTLTPPPPSQQQYSTRKFSFANLRRLSNTTLARTESMVSLSYKTLSTFVTEDDLEGLQNYLENKRVVIDDRSENGATALHVAATRGKLQFVRELLNHSADVNAEDNDNWTPLLCAAKEGHIDVCRELLEREANIEHRDMGGWSALMWASYKGYTDLALMFLERGADVNAHGNFHISSLIWAAGRGHTDIALALIRAGAKVNIGDKYGTTALVWAARKGNAEIVDALLKAGANVDTAGMYSWTPLLVATKANHIDVVTLLLECRPNVNAVDKDGCSALTIACKDGFTEIATALLNAGAYINIQDRSGDTNLIHAVKGGHRSIVEALLKKYADVDIPGKDKKTALYTAVERGNIPILKILLNANPDLEIATKDGYTPLLRAVRSRNVEAVQLLLEKKARVAAADRWGDTALHIAMRARSKAIVEVLLRNPKNSQLLYRPNRAGETPYNIDMSHQKTILAQIFGSRRLNTNEDSENLLGYDLYSSALADILSEPSLSMPITVGLYAKWGSGKSFLLNRLREEMKGYARQWLEPAVSFSWVLVLITAHLSLLVGVIVALTTFSWLFGVISGSALLIILFGLQVLLWVSSQRYGWDTPYYWNRALAQKMSAIKLILQVIFCHPPGVQLSDTVTAQPIRYYFTDQTRVSSTAAAENAVVQMVGSLYDSIESDYGALSTRLYRAFRPKPLKSNRSWRWRKRCCVPDIILSELCFACILLIISVLTVYLSGLSLPSESQTLDSTSAHVILGVCGGFVVLCVVSNMYVLGQLLIAVWFSQRKHLNKSMARLDTVKSEGFLQALRSEVNLMTEMVKCLDAFTQQQTRLVIIVDGLDSCEQDKVLFVLDAVHVLFSDVNTPFIVLLAIDPHIISKAVEANSRRLLSQSNIGGHDYLKNMVHLPFYLQNSGLRKVKVAHKAASNRKPLVTHDSVASEGAPLASSASMRRLSVETGTQLKISGVRSDGSSGGSARQERGNKKLRLSDSIASSLGSNLNRAGGPQDLTKILVSDDYFSDVNPRSMRRLMNVVYVTGRLLKAFHLDFNWYHLATWINITEQWPYRTSWLILYQDNAEEPVDDNMSLKSLYDKVRGFIPVSKEVEPLLELDRDEKKLDVFLTFHRSSLLVGDLRIFLPFTINLDPYIKKVIKEELQNVEETGGGVGGYTSPLSSTFPSLSTAPNPVPLNVPWQSSPDPWGASRRPAHLKRQRSLSKSGPVNSSSPASSSRAPWSNANSWVPLDQSIALAQSATPFFSPFMPPAAYRPTAVDSRALLATLPSDFSDVQLETLSVSGVGQLIQKIPDLQKSQINNYVSIIHVNNISGRVLLTCDLNELKQVLKMNFGDWEIFRMVILALRDSTFSRPSNATTDGTVPRSRSVAFQSSSASVGARPSSSSTSEKERSKQSAMEKQVTLEEQMICGALQTLNEEACEDVLEENTTVIEPPVEGGLTVNSRGRTFSISSCYSNPPDETDVIILQTSPLTQPQWVPTGCDSQSTTGSSVGNTPVLSRRSPDEEYHKEKLSPRPSSLTVNLLPTENCSSHPPTLRSLSADDGSTSQVPKESLTKGPGSGGLLSGVAMSLVGNLRGVATQEPDDDDDESTPLVSSNISSPLSPDPGPSSSNGDGGGGLAVISFRSNPNSSDSLSGILDSIGSSSSLSRRLPRQHALSWDDPETSV